MPEIEYIISCGIQRVGMVKLGGCALCQSHIPDNPNATEFCLGKDNELSWESEKCRKCEESNFSSLTMPRKVIPIKKRQ